MGIELLNVEKKAINQLKKNLSKDPDNSKLLTQLGALYFVIFYDHNEILKLLEKAINLDPKNDEAMFWLGMFFYSYDKDLEQSKKYLEQALNINPERADCLSVLGSVLLENDGNIDLAIKYLKKSVSLSSDWFLPRYKLAKCLLEKGNFLEAKKVIEMGLQFTTAIHSRSEMVASYYKACIIGNDDEHTRDYKTNNKTDWLDLLKVVNEKIKEEK